MDTRESRTPQEELDHFKEVHEPEDFDNPEPDEDQPEARSSAQGLHWALLGVGVVVVAVVIFVVLRL